MKELLFGLVDSRRIFRRVDAGPDLAKGELVMKVMKNLLVILLGLTVTSAANAVTRTYQQGFDYFDTVDEFFQYNGFFASSPTHGFIEFDAPEPEDSVGKYGYILFGNVFGPGEEQVPVDPTTNITSATLTGWVNNGFDSATIYRLLDDITNRPVGGDPAVIGGEDRLDAPGVAGTFYDDANGSQAFDTQPSNSPDPPAEIVWDVTDIVSAWATGATHHGFLLLNDNDSGGAIVSSHAEVNGSNGFRPLLTIEFEVALPVDFDGSGEWDLADLNLVLFNWDQPAASLPPEWINQLPVDNVGLEELNLVLFNWGQGPTSIAAVPEPNVCVLVVFGLLVLGTSCGRRR